MSYGWAFVVILVTALVCIGWGAWIGSWASRPRVPVERLADPAPLPGELPRAGLFPVDTGPLLILSEKAAANAALEREIPRLCAEAEAKIPPRWR